MNVGFTGTRNGMTLAQRKEVENILELHSYRRLTNRGVLHNGLAIGADKDAAVIARNIGWTVAGYPSDRPEQTCDFVPDWYAQDPKPPLKRNPDIVDASEVMIATPGEFHNILRSGTWATIRYTRINNKPLYIVWPDGTRTNYTNT
jgi:hypothetical protein